MNSPERQAMLEAENRRLRQINRALQAQLAHQKTIDEHIEHLMMQAGMGGGDGRPETVERLTGRVPLNNWSAHRLWLHGLVFATAEHAFQYAKAIMLDKHWAQQLLEAPSPWEAKRLSRQRAIDQAVWDTMRHEVMREIVSAKFQQHADVRAALAATGYRDIVEDEGPDAYWGIGVAGNGSNHLGRLWMELRQ